MGSFKFKMAFLHCQISILIPTAILKRLQWMSIRALIKIVLSVALGPRHNIIQARIGIRFGVGQFEKVKRERSNS